MAVRDGRLIESEEDEEELFDAGDDGSSVYGSCLSSTSDSLRDDGEDWVNYDPHLDVWLVSPLSIEERRRRFKKWLVSPQKDCAESNMQSSGDGEIFGELDTGTSDSGTELRNMDSENGHSASSWSSGSSYSSENGRSNGNQPYMIKNLDDGSVFVAADVGQDGNVQRLRKLGTDQIITVDELHRTLESSFVQRMMRREDRTSSRSHERVSMSASSTSSDERVSKGRKVGWLKKLGVAACVIDREGSDSDILSSGKGQTKRKAHRRFWVHSHKKHTKEFSAVYLMQEIRAHKGAIWTMKFSPDGQYLASGGEGGIVRVWKVVERPWSSKDDVLGKEPSCIYLVANRKKQLSSGNANEEKKRKLKVRKSSSNSTIVVLPTKIFSIVEKPLHEFSGHDGDILSLSWSKNKCLISSSTDKTVRLWQVGCDRCVGVFSHGDYVTSVEFNPMDDNHFISGSIDGKVRVWNANTFSVVGWTNIKDMVTAVSYRPDGMGVVIGTMAGTCRFYNISDNHMQLDKEISLHSKKKSSGKMVTGFQFSRTEPQKLVVSSADSCIRVLNGYDIVSKYKGLRNVKSNISASFAFNGTHIISASEDSNVYIWNQRNCISTKHTKSSVSYEHFLSTNVSVAIPWDRLESRYHVSAPKATSPLGEVFQEKEKVQDFRLHTNSVFLGGPGVVPSSTLSDIFVDDNRRGSSTWPEEKLTLTSSPILCKSRYKSSKPNYQNRITPHAWGQVIVTAGCDGRIKAFHNYGLPVRA